MIRVFLTGKGRINWEKQDNRVDSRPDKGTQRLGVMKDGLGVEYCWFVAVLSEVSILKSRELPVNSKSRAPN